jgi:hypothetical protein
MQNPCLALYPRRRAEQKGRWEQALDRDQSVTYFRENTNQLDRIRSMNHFRMNARAYTRRRQRSRRRRRRRMRMRRGRMRGG